MSAWRIGYAAGLLRAGGVIACPTEAVWGLSCDPFNLPAVERLVTMKMRSPDKGLILVAAELAQVEDLLEPLAGDVHRRVTADRPDAVTWLLPARRGVPDLLTGGSGRLAVRVSAHPLLNALCRRLDGPLVSTSANPTGRRPALDALTVRRYFDGALDFILYGRLGGLATPTPIRDALSGRVLRN